MFPNRLLRYLRLLVAVYKPVVWQRISIPLLCSWVYNRNSNGTVFLRRFNGTKKCNGFVCARPFSTETTTQDSNIDKLVAHITQGTPKRIAVMTGAGLSTASGLPDFRSPGSGLYDNLKDYDLPYPEAVFDIGYFYQRPEAFYRLAKELYPSGDYRPNLTHYFLRLLQEKNILHCLFTQNIDGLERMAGIREENLVEAHGSFNTATCLQCRRKYDGKDIKDDILQGSVPKCVQENCLGIIKPDVVFFGENLPTKFHNSMHLISDCDLLIIVGTSLEVQPFASLASEATFKTCRVLFNREASGTFLDFPRKNDLFIQGDIVKNFTKVASLLGWNKELDNLMNMEKDRLDHNFNS